MTEIPLRSRKYPGLVALVDDADAELVSGYTWCPVLKDKRFYAQAHVPGSGKGGKTVRMHRLIAGESAPKVDHENRNGLDNRRENLRFGTDSQHSTNQDKQRNNTSGFIGVVETTGGWFATLTADKESHYLGYYRDPVEAAMVRDYAARQIHGEFAVLNFPHAFGS
jgi:hypothetical protein